MLNAVHQYIDRATGDVVSEQFYSDRVVQFVYGTARERAPALYRALTSARMSGVLGWLNYDSFLGARLTGSRRFVQRMGISLDECVEPADVLDTPRKIFERQIRWWECRPTSPDLHAVVSPADSRVVCGPLPAMPDGFVLKEKFFSVDELVGDRGAPWLRRLRHGDFAICRLTPEKYHYVHTPVAGVVLDIYELPGRHHACNPAAVVAVATPNSKNARLVTVIDTDVPGGTQVGVVVMVEIVALMIGRIVPRYSDTEYGNPRPIAAGNFIWRGVPKSLFQPGSSTVVLLFEPGRVCFAGDLIANRAHPSAQSRYSLRFGEPLVETDVAVRSLLAHGAQL